MPIALPLLLAGVLSADAASATRPGFFRYPALPGAARRHARVRRRGRPVERVCRRRTRRSLDEPPGTGEPSKLHVDLRRELAP